MEPVVETLVEPGLVAEAEALRLRPLDRDQLRGECGPCRTSASPSSGQSSRGVAANGGRGVGDGGSGGGSRTGIAC